MNLLLKSIGLSVALLAVGTNLDAQSREPSEGHFSVQANFGYTSFGLKEASDVYHELLKVYEYYGIPVPTQTEYAPNLVIGVAGLYTKPNGTSFGFGSQFSNAYARSSYADYSGTANVDSDVSFLTLEGIFQHEFQSASPYHFFVSVRGGLSFIHADYNQSIVFYDFPAESGNFLVSGNGTGYTVEGMAGIKRSLGRVDLMAAAGYRTNAVSELDATVSGTGTVASSGTMSVTHDLSGFALNLIVAYRF